MHTLKESADMPRLASIVLTTSSVVSAVCLATLAYPSLSRLVTATGQRTQQGTQAVYPPASSSAPVTELSDLVASLLPATGFNGRDWTFAAENPRIIWQTAGVTSDGTRHRGAVTRACALPAGLRQSSVSMSRSLHGP